MGRLFFITANGYMGIGSMRMEVGDSICVLFGGEPLFILRPFKAGHHLVRDCYVHGLMHGEAMQMLETGEAPIFTTSIEGLFYSVDLLSCFFFSEYLFPRGMSLLLRDYLEVENQRRGVFVK